MNAKTAARLVAAVAAAVLAAPRPALAAAPATPKDIPVFPGSTRDAAAEQEGASQAGPTVPDGARWLRSYASTAAAEDVFRFYEKALGAKYNDGWYDGITSLATWHAQFDSVRRCKGVTEYMRAPKGDATK